VSTFARYQGNLEDYPFIEKLYKSEKFQTSAKNVCPADKQYIQPFQWNILLQVPG
jgi:hypothetical protein